LLQFNYALNSVYKRYDKDGRPKGGSLELSLKEEDTYHLYNFLYDLKSNYKVVKRKIKLNEKEFMSARTTISSIDMVNDLIKQGCVPNKSLILEPPKIDDCFISHFIRGYFDGDGCVGFYCDTYNSFSYEILGTYKILKFIKDYSGISKNISIRKLKNKNIFSLRISGRNSIEIFHNYIYKNKTVFLQRKYDKSLKMLKYLGLDITERSETASMADLLD
jgi:hypothetical protein